MKLIIGLGNPGLEYDNTRHNIGFMFLDYYLNNKFSNCIWKKKFNGLYYTNYINNEKIIFLKPQTFMNNSGMCVKEFVDFFHINIFDILVISDDLDLNVGNFKLKNKGSSGGHNGLKSIENYLKSNEYKRLKIGIAKDNNKDIIDYVLGKISSKDLQVYNSLFSELSNVIDDFYVHDFNILMNKYNKKNR